MRRWATTVFLFCVLTRVASAHDATAPSTIEHLPLDKISEHIYIVHGAHELPNADNRGFMNNPGAIVTSKGVVIVDPGSSAQIARELLQKVRKISNQPVIAVFNTHVHGDHWLGNDGIRAAYPDVPIYAHERMLERIKKGEGEIWVTRFMDMTEGAIAGTKVAGPTIGVKGGEVLKFGEVSLRLHHTGPAHTNNDLMIEVVEDKGLFFGDVLVTNRVPNSDVPEDANYQGTITAIKTMLEGDATLFIPGHGHSGGREIPESSLQFLQTLYGAVKKHYEAGLADFEMKDEVIAELSAYKDWHNFDSLGRVISYVYQEIERENF